VAAARRAGRRHAHSATASRRRGAAANAIGSRGAVPKRSVLRRRVARMEARAPRFERDVPQEVRAPHRSASGVLLVDAHEAVLVRIGQRPQEDAIERGEERGRAADPESERQEGGCGKPLVAEHGPPAEPDVLEDSPHGGDYTAAVPITSVRLVEPVVGSR
jgi:hypothetical protein